MCSHSASAAIVTFDSGVEERFFTNGVHTASGTITDGGTSVGFNMTTTISGMDTAGQTGNASADSHVFAGSVLDPDEVRLGLRDQRAGGGNWEAEWTFSFDQPLDNIVLPDIPGVMADLADWGVSWVGSSGTADFTNSPAGVAGLWSVGTPSSKLPDGTLTSGDQWRFDDNATPNEGNVVSGPTFEILLPEAVTELSISFSAHPELDGQDIATETMFIDFSNATFATTTVPEPSSLALLGLVGIGAAGRVVRRRRRRRRAASNEIAA